MLWKNEETGETGKNGGFVLNFPIFSDVPPISYQFHPFFLHFLECLIGNFSQFPISPHLWSPRPAAHFELCRYFFAKKTLHSSSCRLLR